MQTIFGYETHYDREFTRRSAHGMSYFNTSAFMASRPPTPSSPETAGLLFRAYQHHWFPLYNQAGY